MAGVKRIGLLLTAICLVTGVVAVGLLRPGDGSAQAQGTAGPVLLLEVGSWAEGEVDPTTWQWAEGDGGSLHVGFWEAGKLGCIEITLPVGVTATYADKEGTVTTIAGPADPVEMCEAVFARVNG
jgi:hypothetical protein